MYAMLRCGGNLPLCLAFGTGVLGVLWWLGGWHSVPERATYGTEYACRAQKGFLWYATHLQRPAEQPTPQTVDSLLPHRTHLQCAKRPRSEVSRHKKRVTSASMVPDFAPVELFT